ncbi:MAG: OmpA family protein [Candidatus Competibacteraceae bacterium]|jgi:OOP family OmpA-OmpF porin|nr:OmpA family protein [Candidatus Competibacteraceae bacterium]
MKVRLSKHGLSLVASVAFLAVAVPVQAQPVDAFVQCGSGGPVRDPYGNCVLSIGGQALPGCIEVAVVAPPPVTPVVETITLGADAFFDFDKATLKPEGRAKLDELAADMRRVESVSALTVVGHTDSKGSESYNQRLSQRRAAAVADYLVQRGVDPAILTAFGEGESNPIAPNTTPDGRDNPAGRAQNRRVEVTVEASEKLMQ